MDRRRLLGSGRALIGVLVLWASFPCWVGAVEGIEAPLGKVDSLKGEVSVQRTDGREMRGEAGLSLYAGDQITTGKAAEVRFVLPPGRQFRLGPEAQVSIDELSSSGEGDDEQPALRLVLGYLWSRIERLRGKPVAFELHTPTAVLGLRGTEFDTVVSLDAASLVTVDEGKVEVDADGASVLLEQGKMTEVEFEEKPSPPSPAISKEARDWQAWREKRIEQTLQKLPRMAPRFRHRFEQAALRSGNFAETVEVKGDAMRKTMQEVRAARQSRDRVRARDSMDRLREQTGEFKNMAARFRQGLNRFRVMGRLSIRLDHFVRENRSRFSERQLTFIQAQFAAIAEKREEVRESHRKAISTIREVFRDLKAFREEMGFPRGAAGSS